MSDAEAKTAESAENRTETLLKLARGMHALHFAPGVVAAALKCEHDSRFETPLSEAEALRIAATAGRPERVLANPTDNRPPELDLSRIVRPELFHTPDVSGLAVPVSRLVDGKPSGHWELYLRWHADGRRESRELASSIELPGGKHLWAN